MKKSLNEQISRIKDMMGKVMTESFTSEGPSDEAKLIAQKVLGGLATSPDFEADLENSYHGGGEIELPIANEDGEMLRYLIDVHITGGSSFSPGRYWMSNGDPGYPDEYTEAEYDFSEAYLEITNASGQLVYKGKDFTDILNFKLPNGKTMDDWMYNKFDESIREWEHDRD